MKNNKKVQAYSVVDVECTTHCTMQKIHPASPFDEDNRIVSFGAKTVPNNGSTEVTQIERYETYLDTSNINSYPVSLLVGHNFKFDLHYLFKHNVKVNAVPVSEWIADGGKIWDTQLAEYILSGQSNLYPSLDECAVKYGGELKDDRIKTMWDAGVSTEDIPPEMLEEYHKGDLNNTDTVFIEQVKAAKASGKLSLIRAMNEALLAFTEMEHNGMKINRLTLAVNSSYLEGELALVDENIDAIIKLHASPKLIDIGYDVNSPVQLSHLLFGGTIKYKEKEQVGHYKNGKPKYKNVEKELCSPLFNVKYKSEWKTKRPDVIQTGDAILSEIVANSRHPHVAYIEFIKLIQKRRAIVKELTGYYYSIPNLLFADNLIHQNINNCATHTGRLSQNSPNLQNISTSSDSQLKTIFVSRWGNDGVIVDADYSQLEVIALAFLSQDSQLITDIITGTDMHDETLKKVEHLLPAHLSKKEKRRVVKSINFGLIYGGGANTLSKQAGVPVSAAKASIDAFYDRYPGVKRWQGSVYREVEKSRVPNGTKTEQNKPQHAGKYKSITGREYTFLTYDAKSWQRSKGIDTSFTPTQTSNYPVQGFATGDIVPMVVGILFRALKSDPRLRDNCLMINTVHDSIIFDCKKEYLKEAVTIIKSVMEDAPMYLKGAFGINFNLPLNVEVTAGPNWKDQKVVS